MIMVQSVAAMMKMPAGLSQRGSLALVEGVGGCHPQQGTVFKSGELPASIATKLAELARKRLDVTQTVSAATARRVFCVFSPWT